MPNIFLLLGRAMAQQPNIFARLYNLLLDPMCIIPQMPAQDRIRE